MKLAEMNKKDWHKFHILPGSFIHRVEFEMTEVDLDVLRNFGPRTFLLNQEAFGYLELFKLPAPVVSQLQSFPQGQPLAQHRFSNLLIRKTLFRNRPCFKVD
mgnify:CR=1 FL=1